MSATLETIIEQVNTLSFRERGELALHMEGLDIVDPAAATEKAAFDAMIRRRIEDMETGRVVGRNFDEVFEQLRKEFP